MNFGNVENTDFKYSPFATSATSFAVDLPAVSAGDTLIVVGDLNSTSQTLSASGYTADAGNASNASGFLGLFKRLCDGSEGATATFNASGAGGTASFVAMKITGADSTTPLNIVAFSTASGGSNWTTPAVTPTVNNGLLFSVGHANGNTTYSSSKPASMALVKQANLSTVSWLGLAFETLSGSSSGVSTGTRQWTNISFAKCTLSFVVAPGAGPTGSGAATESGNDTASSTGAVGVAGTGASTESGADTVSSTGTSPIATVAVSSLTEKTNITGNELIAIEDAGVAKSATPNDLRAFMADAFAVLSADYSLTSTTSLQKLFDYSANGALTLPVGAYQFEALLYITGMSGASGNAQFDLVGAGSAAVTPVVYAANGIDATAPTTAAAQTGSFSTTPASAAAIVSPATGTAMGVLITGAFIVTAGGTIIPSIALLTAAAAVVKAGSFFRLRYLGSGNFGGAWS